MSIPRHSILPRLNKPRPTWGPLDRGCYVLKPENTPLLSVAMTLADTLYCANMEFFEDTNLKTFSPVSGEVIAEIEKTPPAEVKVLVERAREAQKAWGALSLNGRSRKIKALCGILAERTEEIAETISKETGKPLLESIYHEVFAAAELARYFGSDTPKILKKRRISIHLLKYRSSYLHYVPRGVIGIITPWNYPFTISFGDVVMALAAGNAVVLKPSEVTPTIGLKIKEVIEAAGIDPELLQIAMGGGEVGAALVEGGTDMIHFTGSGRTGRIIAEACGRQLIPYVLELGGKDAAIVLDDADLDYTAGALVHGGFANTGQICASVERIYALESVYEPLVKRIVEKVQGLRQGDGLREEVDVGPMIFPKQLSIVERQVAAAVEAGATVRTGGSSRDGRYFEPTVLTDVTDDMAVMREETFGPTLPIMKVKDVEEAIAKANDSRYGLSAYVFTRNTQRGREIAERLEAGTVDVNDVLLTHAIPETPWGGVKDSGIGVAHSAEGLRHFCQQRHVNYNILPSFAMPWVFPYQRRIAFAGVDFVKGLYGSSNLLKRLLHLLRGSWQVVMALRSSKKG